MKGSKYLFANHRESQEWYVYGNFTRPRRNT